jgi:hypothetical protein
MTTSSMPWTARRAHACAVVATVEVEGLDLGDQAACDPALQGGGEQHDVVTVGGVGCPAEGDAGTIGEERPLPPAFAGASEMSGVQ